MQLPRQKEATQLINLKLSRDLQATTKEYNLLKAFVVTEKKGEDFNRAARFWFLAALIMAALTLIVVLSAAIVVINQRNAEDTQRTAQAFSPFLLACLAGVTFCGAVWRGMLNSEQTRQQQRQNDAKDEENLAKLLLDGTKLVSEQNSNPAQIRAGIAALQVITASQNDRFGLPAMDILIDIISSTYQTSEQHFIFEAARIALDAGAKNGMSSTRALTLESPEGVDIGWAAVNGLKKVRYKRGSFSGREFSEIRDIRACAFHQVTFEDCEFPEDIRMMYESEFVECKFKRLTFNLMNKSTFDNCDFSGAQFYQFGSASRIAMAERKLVNGGGYFYKGNPPQGIEAEDIARILTSRPVT